MNPDAQSVGERYDSGRLFRRLLDLAIASRPPEAVIEESLTDILDLFNAALGYVELRGSNGEVVFSRSAGRDARPVDGTAAITSQVLETGRVGRSVVVADTSPTSFGLVRQFSAAVCAPIGSPPRGVVYMQRDQPLPFEAEEQRLLELFATVVAKFASAQLVGGRPLSADADEAERRLIRVSLARNGGNKVATARELEIDRSTLYRKLKSLKIA